jgi:hypothetical protein
MLCLHRSPARLAPVSRAPRRAAPHWSRRARAVLLTQAALLGLCVLGLLAGLPVLATARPVVTVRTAVVPIPIDPSNPHSATYPGTGAILGAPAALELEAKIGGTEYWGSPSPLTLIKTYAPAGVTVHTQGFPTCSEATLQAKGSEGCPKGSLAGPVGEANGVVSFGGTRVHERVTLEGFFNPAGGLIFNDVGYTPTSVEILEKVTVTGAAPPFSKLWTAEVPLVESVPGAPDASVEQFKVEVGAAFKQGGRLVSYTTAPRTCPKGGAPIKVELSFLSGETIPVEQRFPCPKHRRG